MDLNIASSLFWDDPHLTLCRRAFEPRQVELLDCSSGVVVCLAWGCLCTKLPATAWRPKPWLVGTGDRDTRALSWQRWQKAAKESWPAVSGRRGHQCCWGQVWVSWGEGWRRDGNVWMLGPPPSHPTPPHTQLKTAPGCRLSRPPIGGQPPPTDQWQSSWSELRGEAQQRQQAPARCYTHFHPSVLYPQCNVHL